MSTSDDTAPPRRRRAVLVISHNARAEGAPRQCAKLAAGLQRHATDGGDSVALLALSGGANPEPGFRLVGSDELLSGVVSLLCSGADVCLVWSTVVACGVAAGFGERVRSAVSRAGLEGAGALSSVGLIHEVRNGTFAWVAPRHFAGLDRLAFVARYTCDSYGPDFAPGVPRTVIPNWLDAAERARMDAAPRPSDDPDFVLMVGVVAPHKGQLHVAEAFARVAPRCRDGRPMCLVLAGHVYDAGYAEAVVEAAEGRATLLGAVPHEKVVHLMRSCAAFAHGSPMESCCLSVMEAMYCGCAIAAARVGGIPEQITHARDGWLFEHGDLHSCSDALAVVTLSGTRRDGLRAQARATAEDRFADETARVRDYAAVIDSAVTGGAGGGE